jgi:hypothetical protein
MNLQRLAHGNPQTATLAWNFLTQPHNRQINTLQQTIVTNECMNRKSDVVHEFVCKNHEKWSSR